MTTYTGTNQADYLTAFQDGDILIGNGGDDSFGHGMEASWFRAEGGTGDDLFSVGSIQDVVVENRNEGVDTVWLYAADPYLLPDNVENLAFFSDAATDADGNALGNEIVANGGANALAGHAGDDTLRGEGGGDRLDGGEGSDFLDAGGGAAVLSTGTGRDVVYVNKQVVEAHYVVADFDPAADRIQVRGFWDYTLTQVGADTLLTFSDYVTVLLEGVDAATVTDANFDMAPRPDAHTFVGTDGVESLYGWADGDALYGLDGGDYFGDHNGDWSRFHGGEGSDTFEIDNELDEVVEVAGEGHDLVWLFGLDRYVLPDNVEDINLMGPVELTGNALANAVQGSGGDDVILGLGGDDHIRANFGGDFIDGGEGDDLIDGGGGQSTLVGGAGRDRFFVSWDAGNHVVVDFSVDEDAVEVWDYAGFAALEQVGDDTLVVFSDRTNLLLEGVSGEALTSGNFNFMHAGTAAADRLAGGAYVDTMNGNGGADFLAGRGGADSIAGGSGGDRLVGGAGADILRAGGGADVVAGGAGQDVLIGGNGADTFVFDALSRSGVDAPDRIWGFDATGGDVIDLSRLDADSTTAADDAFAFVASFSGQAGEAVLRFDAVRGQTTVSVDATGDGEADLALIIRGEIGPEAGWVL